RCVAIVHPIAMLPSTPAPAVIRSLPPLSLGSAGCTATRTKRSWNTDGAAHASSSRITARRAGETPEPRGLLPSGGWPVRGVISMTPLMDNADVDRDGFSERRGAGGTPGGVGTFFVGFAMAVAGAYLLTEQVMVSSGVWQLWGYSSFGLAVLPLIAGIG